MSPDELSTAVRRVHGAALNDRDVDALDGLLRQLGLA